MKRKEKKVKRETNKTLPNLIHLPDEHIQTLAKTLKEFSKVEVPRIEFPDYLLDAVKEVNKLSALTDIQLNITKQVEEMQKALTIPRLEIDAITKVARSYQEVYKNLSRIELVNIKPVLDLIDSHNESLGLVQKIWDEYFKVNQDLIEKLTKSFDIRHEIAHVQLGWLDAAEAGIFVVNRSLFQSKVRELEQYPTKLGNAVKNVVELDKKGIEDFLIKIKGSIERHGIYGFWESKGDNRLLKRPERIAQALISTNLCILLPKDRVVFDEHPQIGIGKIDILITFFNGSALERIVLELKVFKDGDNFDDGIKQTFNYLRLQEVDFGFRFIFNASKTNLQSCLFRREDKTLKDIIVDINPKAPSNL